MVDIVHKLTRYCTDDTVTKVTGGNLRAKGNDAADLDIVVHHDAHLLPHLLGFFHALWQTANVCTSAYTKNKNKKIEKYLLTVTTFKRNSAHNVSQEPRLVRVQVVKALELVLKFKL